VKPYRFHRQADAEFIEAAQHYVWVIAVSPFKRESGYWRDRLR
jgi:hypothetical protein